MRAAAAVAAAVAALLSGCASLNTLDTEVTRFGAWPAGRSPGSFVFERLPSQQAQPKEQDLVEASARGALLAAGFTPADSREDADVVVQLGVRITQQAYAPWDDPFWWPGGWARWGGWGPGHGPYYGRAYIGAGWRCGGGWGGGWGGWGPYGAGPGWQDGPDVEREVAVLLRDRPTGQPLYESHATSAGYAAGGTRILSGMFTAALEGFPKVDPTPVDVRVLLQP
jgi:hypothetical protein